MNYSSRLLDRNDEIILQYLLEECSDYFELVYGRKTLPNEADEIFNALPEGKNYDDKFVLGFFDSSGKLFGISELIRDYPVESSWCLGLMIIVPSFRNNGTGRRIYDDIEIWAVDLGAKTIILGVVEQNQKALRFWQKMGYSEIRRKHDKFDNIETTVIVLSRNPVS